MSLQLGSITNWLYSPICHTFAFQSTFSRHNRNCLVCFDQDNRTNHTSFFNRATNNTKQGQESYPTHPITKENMIQEFKEVCARFTARGLSGILKKRNKIWFKWIQEYTSTPVYMHVATKFTLYRFSPIIF